MLDVINTHRGSNSGVGGGVFPFWRWSLEGIGRVTWTCKTSPQCLSPVHPHDFQ
jgi:hypothetical protein